MGDTPIYTVELPVAFVRKAKKFLAKHPDLRQRYDRIVDTLARDPFTPSLRLHMLSGEQAGLWAVRINYEYRITLYLDRDKRTITLDDIGSHGEVYGSGDDD